METITDIEQLRAQSLEGATFILFGGPACGVCQALKPRLDAMLEEQFPEMQGVYVDCEKSPDICAQHGVFSLPVVKVYIEGMMVVEEAGAFSLQLLAQNMERPYIPCGKHPEDASEYLRRSPVSYFFSATTLKPSTSYPVPGLLAAL